LLWHYVYEHTYFSTKPKSTWTTTKQPRVLTYSQTDNFTNVTEQTNNPVQRKTIIRPSEDIDIQSATAHAEAEYNYMTKQPNYLTQLEEYLNRGSSGKHSSSRTSSTGICETHVAHSYETIASDQSETWQGAEKPIVIFDEYYPTPPSSMNELPVERHERLKELWLTKPPPPRYSRSIGFLSHQSPQLSTRSYILHDHASQRQPHRHHKRHRIRHVPRFTQLAAWPSKPKHPTPTIITSANSTNVPTIIKEKFTPSEIRNALKPHHRLPKRSFVSRKQPSRKCKQDKNAIVQPQDDRRNVRFSDTSQNVKTVNLQSLTDDQRDLYMLQLWQKSLTSSTVNGPREYTFPSYGPREYPGDLAYPKLDVVKVIQKLPYYPEYCTRIVYVDGSIFDSTYSKAHCVSADLHMALGIAKQFRDRYKHIQTLFNLRCGLGEVAVLTPFETRVAEEYIFHLITKTRYFHKPRYNILETAIVNMCDLAMSFDLHFISMPLTAR